MKTPVILAGLLLAATVGSASAVEVWQGDIFITGANNTCKPTWTVNDFFRAVFRPAGLSDNGADTRLALFSSRATQRYTVTGGPLAAGNYSATAIFSSAGLANWTGTLASANVKPATPSATTAAVAIKAKINDFSNIIGCAVTVEGTITKRPDL